MNEEEDITYPKYVCPKTIPNPFTPEEKRKQLGNRITSTRPINEKLLEMIDPVTDSAFESRKFVTKIENLLEFPSTERGPSHLKQMADSVKSNRKFKYMKEHAGEEMILKAFKHATIRTYRKGEQIQKINEKFEQYYILLEGKVSIQLPFLHTKRFNSLFDYALFKTTHSNRIARETKLPMFIPKQETRVASPMKGTRQIDIQKAEEMEKCLSSASPKVPVRSKILRRQVTKRISERPSIFKMNINLNLDTMGAGKTESQGSEALTVGKEQITNVFRASLFGTENIVNTMTPESQTDPNSPNIMDLVSTTREKERRLGMTLLGMGSVPENKRYFTGDKSNIISEEVQEEDPVYTNKGQKSKGFSSLVRSYSPNNRPRSPGGDAITPNNIPKNQLDANPHSPYKRFSKDYSPKLTTTPNSEYLSDISSMSDDPNDEQDLPFTKNISQFMPQKNRDKPRDLRHSQILQDIFPEQNDSKLSDTEHDDDEPKLLQIIHKIPKKGKKESKFKEKVRSTEVTNNINVIGQMNIKFTILEDVIDLHGGDGLGDFSYAGNSHAQVSLKAKTLTKLIIISKFDFSPIMRYGFFEKINKMVKYLQEIPLFVRYQKPIMIELASNIILKSYTLNQFVFMEGDIADGLFIVKDGEFEVNK